MPSLHEHAQQRVRWLTALALSAALLTGCTLTSRTSEPITQPPVQRTEAAPPPVTTEAPPLDLNQLKEQLQEYLSDQPGTYGVYVVDLGSRSGIGINENAPFPAASTFKLPMAMYILDQVAKGKASLDETISYTAADWEDGTGVLLDSIQDGEKYTVRRLVELAITESDNIATNMLLRRFPKEDVYAYMQSLGGTVTEFDDTNGTTPREMARYMAKANDNRTIPQRELRRFLLDLLTHTAFDDRAAAGVPDGVKVAHKIGTLPGVVNDVALVYAPHRTFVVSVFSTGVNEETAAEAIAEMTHKVYDFETNLTSNMGPTGPPPAQAPGGRS